MPGLSLQRTPEQAAPATRLTSAGTQATPAAENQAESSEREVDELAERVIRKVLRSLSVERERRGAFPWR